MAEMSWIQSHQACQTPSTNLEVCGNLKNEVKLKTTFYTLLSVYNNVSQPGIRGTLSSSEYLQGFSNIHKWVNLNPTCSPNKCHQFLQYFTL